MKRSYLIAARRTAVAPRNGRFAALSVHELAAPVVRNILRDACISEDQVGELIVSNSLGSGGNPARLIALASGLPWSVAGLSLDRQCVGGLDAILVADSLIKSGLHDLIIAGGVESYSRRPLRFRTFPDGSEPKPYEQASFTPWPCRDPDMAHAADRLAQKFEIGRDEQDDWAINSHQKALSTSAKNRRVDIVEVSGLVEDTFTRKLDPRVCARAKVICGSITVANMAVAADAAAFTIIASEEVAKKLKIPSIELVAGVTTGDDPELPGLAPIGAIGTALRMAGLSPNDLRIAEIMEAFAVQAIICQRGANIPLEIVNPHGGSLARGHPIGASGAILAVSLFHALCQNGGIGLAAIAAAGGLGTALIARSG